SAPAPTVVSTVRSQSSAYSCWPERTALFCMRPGRRGRAGAAARGGGVGSRGGGGGSRGGGGGGGGAAAAGAEGSYWARNLASTGRPRASARASFSRVP